MILGNAHDGRTLVRALTLLGLGAALSLVACEESGFQVVKAADGARALRVKCKQPADDCLEEARTACRRGYDVVDSESHEGAALSDDLPGQTLWYSLTFRCTNAGVASGASFPFRGEHGESRATTPSAVSGDGDESSAATPRRASPARAGGSRGCTMDAECGHGSVCAKSVGSSEGVCARSVDSSGMPSNTGPRFGSGAAGERQCLGPMDCGIGFFCDAGRCFKR